jgi:hypothetical protein
LRVTTFLGILRVARVATNMRHLRVSAPVGLVHGALLTIVACGDPPPTPEQAASQWADAVCGRALTCECAAWDDEYCRDHAAARFRGFAVDAAEGLEVEVDAECLDRTLARVGALECSVSPLLLGIDCDAPAPCSILHGDVAEGGACQPLDAYGEASNCAQGLRCDRMAFICQPRCPATVAIGETCGGPTVFCESGAWCHPETATCTAIPGSGEPCTALCQAGSVCSDGTCEASAPGDACTSYAHCNGRCSANVCLDEPAYCKSLSFYDGFPGEP